MSKTKESPLITDYHEPICSCVHTGPQPLTQQAPLQGARGGVEIEEASLLNKLLDGWTQIDQSLPFCLVHLEP